MSSEFSAVGLGLFSASSLLLHHHFTRREENRKVEFSQLSTHTSAGAVSNKDAGVVEKANFLDYDVYMPNK